jgi:hypothetical protein
MHQSPVYDPRNRAYDNRGVDTLHTRGKLDFAKANLRSSTILPIRENMSEPGSHILRTPDMDISGLESDVAADGAI